MLSTVNIKPCQDYGITCPICEGARKNKCRTNDNQSIVWCHSEESLDLNYKLSDKISTNGEQYWVRRNRDLYPSEVKKIQAKKAEREDALVAELAVKPTQVQLEWDFTNLFDGATLNAEHKADLVERGLSESAIARFNFVSLVNGHVYPVKVLTGFNDNGEYVGVSGMVCPAYNVNGKPHAFQVKTSNKDQKYTWTKTTSQKVKNPDGSFRIAGLERTYKLKSGEAPITFINKDSAVIGICEGILKPVVASELLNMTFVGAAGGNFGNSATQIAEILALKPDATYRIYLDAGDGLNSGVLRRVRQSVETWQLAGAYVELAWNAGTCKRKVKGFDVDEFNGEWIIGQSHEFFKHLDLVLFEAARKADKSNELRGEYRIALTKDDATDSTTAVITTEDEFDAWLTQVPHLYLSQLCEGHEPAKVKIIFQGDYRKAFKFMKLIKFSPTHKHACYWKDDSSLRNYYWMKRKANYDLKSGHPYAVTVFNSYNELTGKGYLVDNGGIDSPINLDAFITVTQSAKGTGKSNQANKFRRNFSKTTDLYHLNVLGDKVVAESAEIMSQVTQLDLLDEKVGQPIYSKPKITKAKGLDVALTDSKVAMILMSFLLKLLIEAKKEAIEMGAPGQWLAALQKKVLPRYYPNRFLIIIDEFAQVIKDLRKTKLLGNNRDNLLLVLGAYLQHCKKVNGRVLLMDAHPYHVVLRDIANLAEAEKEDIHIFINEYKREKARDLLVAEKKQHAVNFVLNTLEKNGNVLIQTMAVDYTSGADSVYNLARFFKLATGLKDSEILIFTANEKNRTDSPFYTQAAMFTDLINKLKPRLVIVSPVFSTGQSIDNHGYFAGHLLMSNGEQTIDYIDQMFARLRCDNALRCIYLKKPRKQPLRFRKEYIASVESQTKDAFVLSGFSYLEMDAAQISSLTMNMAYDDMDIEEGYIWDDYRVGMIEHLCQSENYAVPAKDDSRWSLLSPLPHHSDLYTLSQFDLEPGRLAHDERILANYEKIANNEDAVALYKELKKGNKNLTFAQKDYEDALIIFNTCGEVNLAILAEWRGSNPMKAIKRNLFSDIRHGFQDEAKKHELKALGNIHAGVREHEQYFRTHRDISEKTLAKQVAYLRKNTCQWRNLVSSYDDLVGWLEESFNTRNLAREIKKINEVFGTKLGAKQASIPMIALKMCNLLGYKVVSDSVEGEKFMYSKMLAPETYKATIELWSTKVTDLISDNTSTIISSESELATEEHNAECHISTISPDSQTDVGTIKLDSRAVDLQEKNSSWSDAMPSTDNYVGAAMREDSALEWVSGLIYSYKDKSQEITKQELEDTMRVIFSVLIEDDIKAVEAHINTVLPAWREYVDFYARERRRALAPNP